MTDIVLRADAVCLQRGARPILVGVSLQVERGEFVAILGASGSGKTTFLRAVAGLEPFQDGRIEVDGVTLDSGRAFPAGTLRALRRKVGMVFQFHCLFEHLSAIDNVCLAPVYAHGVSRPDAERRGLDQHEAAIPRARDRLEDLGARRLFRDERVLDHLVFDAAEAGLFPGELRKRAPLATAHGADRVDDGHALGERDRVVREERCPRGLHARVDRRVHAVAERVCAAVSGVTRR